MLYNTKCFPFLINISGHGFLEVKFSLVDLYEEPETEIELMVYEDGLVKSVIFDYID